MVAQRFAALVNRNAFLKFYVAALQLADDGLKLLHSPFERHVLDVGKAFCRCFGDRHIVLLPWRVAF